MFDDIADQQSRETDSAVKQLIQKPWSQFVLSCTSLDKMLHQTENKLNKIKQN